MTEGMTARNNPLWFPSRDPLPVHFQHPEGHSLPIAPASFHDTPRTFRIPFGTDQ